MYMKKYVYFIVLLALSFNLSSCKATDKYTLTGCCAEWKMPEDGVMYLSVLDPSKNDIENVLKHTRVEKDGTFKFSGYVKEPQIVVVCSINKEMNYSYHGMCVLEGGNIEMDCEGYEVNRGFFDCVGHGTPTNDKIREFYSVRDSILRECTAKYGVRYYTDYLEVDNYLREYMNRNKDDFSSVFLAMEALYSGASPEDIPDKIADNRFVKAYIDSKSKSDYSSITIEEEIIPISED